jgi:hypothetical protein
VVDSTIKGGAEKPRRSNVGRVSTSSMQKKSKRVNNYMLL